MTYGIVQGDGSIKDFQARPFQQTVNVVCETCNNGWMADLEAAVRSRLGPMIQSARATRLTPWAQRTIAAWAVKTSLMMEYLHPPPRIIPESEYQRFYYAEQQAPHGYLAFLSLWNPEIDARRKALVVSRTNRVTEHSIGHHDPEQLGRLAELFYDGTYTLFHTMFAIGYVAFAVIGHNAPLVLRMDVGPGFDDISQRIWPRGHSITWPPKLPVGGTGALRDFFGERDAKPSQERTP